MNAFPLSKLVGTEAILKNDSLSVSGKVFDVTIESPNFGGPPECTVKFYADAIEQNVGSKKKEVILDLSENCENKKLKARKVIFNPPATIILWEDRTKTVVKCDPEDAFDEMKGIALCYMKKALGNTSRELNRALRKGKENASV